MLQLLEVRLQFENIQLSAQTALWAVSTILPDGFDVDPLFELHSHAWRPISSNTALVLDERLLDKVLPSKTKALIAKPVLWRHPLLKSLQSSYKVYEVGLLHSGFLGLRRWSFLVSGGRAGFSGRGSGRFCCRCWRCFFGTDFQHLEHGRIPFAGDAEHESVSGMFNERPDVAFEFVRQSR